MPNDTELSVWLRAGLQGLNFAFIGRPYDYHTAGDNLARLEPAESPASRLLRLAWPAVSETTAFRRKPRPTPSISASWVIG
jgi:hypothetical protein